MSLMRGATRLRALRAVASPVRLVHTTASLQASHSAKSAKGDGKQTAGAKKAGAKSTKKVETKVEATQAAPGSPTPLQSLDGQELPAAASRWKADTLRTGVIARKRGMTVIWDNHGARCPVTVLQLEHCQVTGNIKHVRPDGTEYHAIQIGAGVRREKNESKAMLGHFNKAGVAPKQIVKEFPVSPDAHLPVGTTLSAIHFVPGQYVDVQAKSVGKGWAGAMKRWGFHGLAASHGVSVSHRSAGSTGQHQDPGRVWPGRKMAGRLGGENATQQNLFVARVDSELNLVYVKGCVPGVDGAHVSIVDAKKRLVSHARVEKLHGRGSKVLPRHVNDLPFPAGTDAVAKELPPIIVAGSSRSNPFVAR